MIATTNLPGSKHFRQYHCDRCSQKLSEIMAKDAYPDERDCRDHGFEPNEVVGTACLNRECPPSPIVAPYIERESGSIETGQESLISKKEDKKMIATTNLPGSKHFRYFRGDRKECLDWLEKRADRLKDECGGLWYNAYSPTNLISEREARKWQYRDGTRVFDF